MTASSRPSITGAGRLLVLGFLRPPGGTHQEIAVPRCVPLEEPLDRRNNFGDDPRLLSHLPQRGLLWGFALVRMTLRESPHVSAVLARRLTQQDSAAAVDHDAAVSHAL